MVASVASYDRNHPPLDLARNAASYTSWGMRLILALELQRWWTMKVPNTTMGGYYNAPGLGTNPERRTPPHVEEIVDDA